MLTQKCLKSFSEANASNPTAAERRLNGILSSLGLKYFRQPFFCRFQASYIPDFLYKHPYYLIIEVDGSYHNQPGQVRKDKKRDYIFGINGYRVLRFTNVEVLENPIAARNKIIATLQQQKKWNGGCKARDKFSSGAVEEIKPSKPTTATQDCNILAPNPSL